MFAALQSLAPTRQETPEPELGFPWNRRALLGIWRALYFTPATWRPDPARSDEWNRGAYLVEGIGHCGACHTPRNVLGASEADLALAGAMIPVQNWYAPNLYPGKGGGLEGWSRADITTFLRSGQGAHGVADGPMAEVVSVSLQHLKDGDAEAIATYLLDPPRQLLPTRRRGLRPTRARERELLSRGREVYRSHCADCHGEDGRGRAGVYPSLRASTSLRGNPVNTIRVVLLGGFAPTTAAHPRPYSMPPFAPTLRDEEVASVVSFIRDEFGAGAGPISPRLVARYRSTPAR